MKLPPIFRNSPARTLGVIAVAFALLASGCNKISTEDARAAYHEGIRLEQDHNYKGALVAYQRAATASYTSGLLGGNKVNFPELPQVEENLGRVAMRDDVRNYDAAQQAYTALATLGAEHPDLTVDANPDTALSSGAKGPAPEGQKPPAGADIKRVAEWIGPATDPNPSGPLFEAMAKADVKNRHDWRYKSIDWLVGLTGRRPEYSYFLALLVFTLVIKIVMTPLTKQQFRTMQKMQGLQPKMKALQEKYKDKPEELNKATMAMYREQGVNPLGCGAGLVIQFPILIALYSVIRLYNFQFRNGWFLWVNPHTAQMAPGILGRSLAQPDMILLGLYAVSMFVSQRLTVMPTADAQAKQQQQMMSVMMPVMFLFVLRTFPSAFILYWLIFNVLTTWQQIGLMRKYPPPPPEAVVVEKAPEAPVKSGPSRTPAKKRKR